MALHLYDIPEAAFLNLLILYALGLVSSWSDRGMKFLIGRGSVDLALFPGPQKGLCS